MNQTRILPTLLLAVAAGCATKSADAGAAKSPDVAADLMADLTGVEKKLVDLAKEIPESKYDWRPGEGVRSVREVLLHLSSDNYLILSMMGFTPDPATGIVGSDYNTAVAFEKRPLSKDSVVAEVARSFGFVKQSLKGATPASMGQPVTMFGEQFTGQSAWILEVTHLHEHLGQLIAYARTNGVKPPWS